MLVFSGVLSILLALIFGTTPYLKFKESIEGIAIFGTVALVLNVAAMTNYDKIKQFKKLKAKCADKDLMVFRNGKVGPVNSREVVVGDILQLKEVRGSVDSTRGQRWCVASTTSTLGTNTVSLH